MKIPETHPRKKSLEERKKTEHGFQKGIVAPAGMIAFGRGEAFDYLLGEKTTPEAKRQIAAAAAQLLLAHKPVISVNGNTTALCAEEIALLAKAIPAQVEINLFYRTKKRIGLIRDEFGKLGVNAMGKNAWKKIPGLESKRGIVEKKGIFSADAVLVMLEDGDRTEYLAGMGKKVVAIDINPLSRTARNASITIVDNVTRAVPLLTKKIIGFRRKSKGQLKKILGKFRNRKHLRKSELIIRKGAAKWKGK